MSALRRLKPHLNIAKSIEKVDKKVAYYSTCPFLPSINLLRGHAVCVVHLLVVCVVCTVNLYVMKQGHATGNKSDEDMKILMECMTWLEANQDAKANSDAEAQQAVTGFALRVFQQANAMDGSPNPDWKKV